MPLTSQTLMDSDFHPLVKDKEVRRTFTDSDDDIDCVHSSVGIVVICFMVSSPCLDMADSLLQDSFKFWNSEMKRSVSLSGMSINNPKIDVTFEEQRRDRTAVV